MELLVMLAIACAALILLVRWFATGLGQPPRRDVRTVGESEAAELLTVEDLVAILDSSVADVMLLIERDAIPFYVRPGEHRTSPAAYRFKPSEIDAWTIG